MAREKRMGKGIFALFIVLLASTVAYYLALFANTIGRFRKWILGQS